MMQRYNESADTFSFALVLLCLAAGDIGYVRKRGRMISRASYALHWRPPIPSKLRDGCPDLASLITEMWDGDFRKRPALKDVVPRLEAASTAALDGVEPTVGSREDEEDSIQPGGGGGGTFDVDALRVEIKALKAQAVKADARHRADRLEIAELKAALLAGTSVECDDDDVGILGGMFICTSICHCSCFSLSLKLTQPTASIHTQSIPTRSAASSAGELLAPSIR